MTTGFGACANCGTPRMAAEQAACATCGAPFTAPPAWATPQTPQAQPQTWQQTPQAQQTPQVQPQTWQQPAQQFGAQPAGYQAPAGQQPGYGQQPGFGQQPGYGQPYAPAYGPGVAPAKKPPIALIVGIAAGVGALLLVIIVAVVLLAGHSSSGGITISPSTISCGTTTVFSETVRLPSSVHAGDVVTIYGDGVEENTMSIDATSWAKQGDGSWLFTYGTTSSFTCTSTGTSAVGHHTMTIKDSNGNLLAEGSYTINP